MNIKEIIFLEAEHLLDVNDLIRQKSKDRKGIQYSGEESYSIDVHKINAIINNTPKNNILEIATYYLKNIILLQPFPDGNHRTALACVELFLNKNGLNIEYSANDAVKFQKEAYNLRLQVYGNYDRHNISILTKPEDEFTFLCKGFIESKLT